MLTDLILPLVLLAGLAWAVPALFGRVLPEGMGWLVVNGALSAALLAAVAGAGFVLLYGEAGDAVWRTAPWHFALLSARSALVWGPVLMLSLADLPRRWTEAEW